MPVRIYDISKKLGLENKEVLAKAKELGITAAKVASSSLDKITAEYLENELTGGKPVATAAPAAPSAPESIIVVKSPPQPAVAPPLEVPATEMPASVKAEPPPIQKQPPVETAQPAMAIAEPEPVKPAIPAPPPVPSGPQVGDKVGFIQLPSKPAPRAGDKLGSVKLPPSR